MLSNKRRGRIIAKNVQVCDSFFPLARGLMFSTKKNDFAMILEFPEERIISLHMLFVFYPIDVVFLNGEKMAVEIKEGFMPFTFYSARKKARYAIELPAGTVKKTRIRAGDRLSF